MKFSGTAFALALAYLLVGLFQGSAFYILFEHDLGRSLPVIAGTTLYFVALLVPLMFYCTAEVAQRQRLVMLGTALLFAVLAGFYHSWTIASTRWDDFPWPELSLPLLLATILVASCQAKGAYQNTIERLFLNCERFFSALVLLGVFWIFINLCNSLFKLVDISIVKDFFLGQKTYFWSGLVFSFGIFLASQSRSKVLTITAFVTRFFSWLYPFAAFIAVIFALILTIRLQMLLDTRQAAAVLLWFIVILAFFFNLKIRAGTEVITSKWLRVTSLLGWLAALPMIGVALYALGLRVNQYGLTPDRFYALWVAIVAVVLVVGYAASHVLRRDSLIAATNMIASGLIVLVTVLITVGIVDPVRLSVYNQMQRLEQVHELNDQVTDTLDFFARSRSVFGQRALQELADRGDSASATETSKAIANIVTQALTHNWCQADFKKLTAAREVATLKVYPQGETLPDELNEALQNHLNQVRGELKSALVWKTRFKPDGPESWVVFSSRIARDDHDRGWDFASVWQHLEGKWRNIGDLQIKCSDTPLAESVLTSLKEGKLRMVPRLPEMDVELPGGKRLHFVPDMCGLDWGK